MNDPSTIRMGQLLEQVQLSFSLSPCRELCSGEAALLAKGRDREWNPDTHSCGLWLHTDFFSF